MQPWEDCQAKLIQELSKASREVRLETEDKNGTTAQWSKVVSQIKVDFAFLLEIKGPEFSWRVERHRIQDAWSPVQNHHSSKSMHPSTRRFYAPVFWQALCRQRFPFPQAITVLVWSVICDKGDLIKYWMHQWICFLEAGHVCIWTDLRKYTILWIHSS